ncbi:MAG TPA: 6-phosphogluconolactonase [Acidimicrobiales bacterium]|nr:6-phosphogluconolactonase [Acidimicrobiales bacterium]
MIGEVRVVPDVGAAFAALVADEVTATSAPRFRLGCSGGASGVACFSRLAAEPGISWGRVECYFADERCVEPTSPDANARAISEALGEVRGELAGFHPMSCAAGPEAYGALVAAAGGFDLLQLGLGPDGHTASLFPGADGHDAPPGALVIANADPSGRNPFERLTLTFEGIARARLVVVTVIGAAKAGPLARIAAGEDLPAGRIRGGRVVWLVDPAAAPHPGGDGA